MSFNGNKFTGLVPHDVSGKAASEELLDILTIKKDTAIKHDSDYMEKPPMELLSGRVLEEVAQVLGFGAQKYSSWNWQSGFDYSRLISGSLRHIMQFKRGENEDLESGLNHISHAICNLMFLRHQMMIERGNDDRGEE